MYLRIIRITRKDDDLYKAGLFSRKIGYEYLIEIVNTKINTFF